jgi:hypothetical protein
MKPAKPTKKRIDVNTLKPNRKMSNVVAHCNLCPVCSSKLEVDPDNHWNCTQKTCHFTSRNMNFVNQVNTVIPDPMVVKRIERSLKRKLTEEEAVGESKLWFLNGRYFDHEVEYGEEVDIPKVQFPDDL